MKLKLFGGSSPVIQQFALQAGGYDADSGKVTFIVRGEDEGQAGTLQLDLAEARRVGSILDNLPAVERVEPKIEALGSPNQQTKPTPVIRTSS